MNLTSRAARRSALLGALLLGAIVSGCGGEYEDMSIIDDYIAQARSVKIATTTIPGVAHETYPGIAWVALQKEDDTKAYKPLSEGQLFGWTLLDKLARERAEAEKRAASGQKKRPGKKRVEKKRETKKQPKKVEQRAPAVEQPPAAADQPDAPPPAAREDEQPTRSRRSRRSRGD